MKLGKWKPRGSSEHEALRTGKEMAEEFGISVQSLAAYMRNHNGPKPRLAHRNMSSNPAQWYSPTEMRAWWKTVGHE
jgi:hypothetical protein